jgi:HAD superfamily hydrolase (TIGR01549 family)
MAFPKAIFLDVGWTLLYPRESLWTVLAEIIGQAGGSLKAGREVERLVHTLMISRRDKDLESFRSGARYEDSDEAFRGMFHTLGQVVFQMAGIEDNHEAWTEKTLQRFWELDNWAVFPDVLPTIRRFRDRGTLVMALSNASSDLVAFLEEIGLAPHLDGMIISAMEGIRKPDPRLFRIALDRAEVAARDAVHVGDMFLEDILGARGLGIRPFLMDRNPHGMFPHHPETVEQDPTGEPVETVRTLDEVFASLSAPG